MAIANKAAVDMRGKTCTAACLNSSGINAQEYTDLGGKYYHSFPLIGERAEVREDDLTKSTQRIDGSSDLCPGCLFGWLNL